MGAVLFIYLFIYLFIFGRGKVGEQSFVQYLAYKEPIFQLFLNQRMIGFGWLGEGAFRIIEPPVLVL
jgi:hypothetical protein